MLKEGVTEPSGMSAETECPAAHEELNQDEACFWCRAAV